MAIWLIVIGVVAFALGLVALLLAEAVAARLATVGNRAGADAGGARWHEPRPDGGADRKPDYRAPAAAGIGTRGPAHRDGADRDRDAAHRRGSNHPTLAVAGGRGL